MNGRPRIIRNVTKMGRDGLPKVVRDRRERITVERVKAQADRRCAAGADCRNRTGGVIQKDWEYAKVTEPTGRRFRGGLIPDVKDYHFSCVPLKALPSTRFFLRNQGIWPLVRDGRIKA